MTKTIEAMKQALKALHPFEKDANGIHKDWSNNRRRASLTQEVQPTVGDYRRVAAAASSLREAIAAQEAPKPTGWDNGLSQDYCKELGSWLANRPCARQQVEALTAERDAWQESRKQALADAAALCRSLDNGDRQTTPTNCAEEIEVLK